MVILRKARSALKLLRQDGIHKVISILRTKYRLPIPQSARSRWLAGIRSELRFWDDYFRTKGLRWADTYGQRLDPDLPLQPRLAELLPPQAEIQILDVGSGPLTYVGKKAEGKRITITAVDPLAEEYDRILAKYQVRPVVRSQKLDAEELAGKFAPNTFDLVVARNCIDHAHNPEKAVLQMIEVVKAGRYVLLEHRPNEAENENYSGLHQWNFSMSPQGEFLIGSTAGVVNMTQKYADRCAIHCEIIQEPGEGDWLLTRIEKSA